MKFFRKAPRDGPGRDKVRARHVVVLAAVVAGLIVVPVASAHQWDSYHWPRSGSYVPIYVYDETGGCGTSGTATNDALWDIYYNPHPIYIYCVGYSTDVNIFRTYEPGAPYCGLAQISIEWWDWWNDNINHGDARWNTACTSGSGLSGKLYAQQIFCQEFAHTLGLDHSNTYDCMGGSYYSGSNYRYYFGASGPYVYDWDHQSSDLYWMYY